MTLDSDVCEKAIRFMVNRIKNFTNPESFVRWCSLALREVDYNFPPTSLSRVLKTRLDRIEDLQGFNLMEKVRLVFIFSRPVSTEFLKILTNANCIVKTNDSRKITYFRSPDGIVLESKQSFNQKRYFKGTPENNKKNTVVKSARRSENVRNPRPATIPQVIPNPLEVDMGNEAEEAAPGPSVNINLANQNQDARARTNDMSLAQNLVQNKGFRVKMENVMEQIQREPEEWIREEKAGMPPLESISLLRLAEQVETLSFNINLDQSFQQKALRAVRLFEANDQTISIENFNQLFNSFLTSLKTGIIENATRKSIQMATVFKQLQRNLIRPLGEELMAEALGILEDEVQKLGDSEDEIPLKTVQIKIDGLMLLITNSWADLNE
ncbi:hypothetical protein B9Z55_027820 [Caenorhabditis nigoni]|uniref:SPK domain-containing protein n=1 Tax=Caenorhabditis nigoni TaxID=1611254 RepID=A0A2G5SEE2_9PELO|nr:hypothetical protein B9Z55_027820 [Caenorhabditis nigoni]